MKLVLDDPDLSRRYERWVPNGPVREQREALTAFAHECYAIDSFHQERYGGAVLDDLTATMYAEIHVTDPVRPPAIYDRDGDSLAPLWLRVYLVFREALIDYPDLRVRTRESGPWRGRSVKVHVLGKDDQVVAEATILESWLKDRLGVSMTGILRPSARTEAQRYADALRQSIDRIVEHERRRRAIQAVPA